MKHDRTFEKESAYGSNEWVAVRLGLTKDTFFRRRDDLYSDGFPKPDPITKHYLKADVDEWINRRRKLTDGVTISGQGVNLDAI